MGLNAPREVVNKIARQGLAGLGREDRIRLADTFDFTNQEHREYVREEYERHLKGSIRDFEAFYEAQLAWEETMAESLVHALKALPETTRVVVLIGNGHIWQGRGVPQNARRRLAHQYRTVIPLPADYALRSLDPGPADYIWITPIPEKTHPTPPGDYDPDPARRRRNSDQRGDRRGKGGEGRVSKRGRDQERERDSGPDSGRPASISVR